MSENRITARAFHAAVSGFSHPGPWRYFPLPSPTIIGHNDIAPYNVCFEGDRLTGVFDWDLAGPSTPLLELAHLAWHGIPLFRPVPAADRLRLRGLDPDTVYRVSGWPDAHDPLVRANAGPRGGDDLMRVGLSLGADRHEAGAWGDFKSWLFVLEAE